MAITMICSDKEYDDGICVVCGRSYRIWKDNSKNVPHRCPMRTLAAKDAAETQAKNEADPEYEGHRKSDPHRCFDDRIGEGFFMMGKE